MPVLMRRAQVAHMTGLTCEAITELANSNQIMALYPNKPKAEGGRAYFTTRSVKAYCEGQSKCQPQLTKSNP